jgi:hypothetical protein
VLEPYFLGQRHDESLARFLEKCSKGLPPPKDSDIGQTLTALGQELAARSDNGAVPCVRVLVEGKQRELNPMLRDGIYRIAREALRNALRHAQAQKIEAEITYGDSEFLLHVRDDGRGVDPTVANQGRVEHWGLPVADLLLDAQGRIGFRYSGEQRIAETREGKSRQRAIGAQKGANFCPLHSRWFSENADKVLFRMAGPTGLEPAASAVTGGFAVTSCKSTAPIATLGATRNPREVLLHCTLIAPSHAS